MTGNNEDFNIAHSRATQLAALLDALHRHGSDLGSDTANRLTGLALELSQDLECALGRLE